MKLQILKHRNSKSSPACTLLKHYRDWWNFLHENVKENIHYTRTQNKINWPAVNKFMQNWPWVSDRERKLVVRIEMLLIIKLDTIYKYWTQLASESLYSSSLNMQMHLWICSSTDVVESYIFLLLLKESMNKVSVKMNSENDTSTMIHQQYLKKRYCIKLDNSWPLVCPNK